jgi:hypothetical protein
VFQLLEGIPGGSGRSSPVSGSLKDGTFQSDDEWLVVHAKNFRHSDVVLNRQGKGAGNLMAER